jgi:hypothetical protein
VGEERKMSCEILKVEEVNYFSWDSLPQRKTKKRQISCFSFAISIEM